MKIPISIGEKLDTIIQEASNLTKTCIQMNQFRFQSKAKRIELIAQNKLRELKALDYPPISSKRKVFTTEELTERYWIHLGERLDKQLEKLQGLSGDVSAWSDAALDTIVSALEELYRTFKGRMQLDNEGKLEEYIGTLTEKSLELTLLTSPEDAIKEALREVVEKMKRNRTFVVNKKSLRDKVSDILKWDIPTSKFEEVLEFFISQDTTELVNGKDKNQVGIAPLKEVIGLLISKVPAEQEGVSYLDLLKRTAIEQELFDALLEKMEQEGKLIRDKEAERGETLYFIELMEE